MILNVIYGLDFNRRGSAANIARMNGQSEAKVSTHSVSDSVGENETLSANIGGATGRGGSNGEGFTLSFRRTPLARNRVEVQRTGRLLHSTTDQFEKMKHELHSLEPSFAVAKLRGVKRAFIFKTRFVDEKWSFDEKFAAIDRIKKHLVESRAYYSPANLSPAQEHERINRFVGENFEAAEDEDVPFDA